MRSLRLAILMAMGTLLFSGALVSAQSTGQVVVTVLPKVDGQPLPPSVAQQDLSVKVNGKNAKVTHWGPYVAPNNRIELVILIDSSARGSLGRQLGEIADFINSLPPNVKAGIAYMTNGQADFVAPLTADHAQILNNLHLPGGSIGSSASPYFCLSDLAKRWPGQDEAARREVVMISDGVDGYQRRYDADDPYVAAAIKDAVRARLVIYNIYWRGQGRADNTEYETNAGQNLMEQVSGATGGKSFWQGQGNPISFESYFVELNRRFRNQYELGFVAPINGKADVDQLKLQLHAPGTEIKAPEKVFMVPAAN